jgi:CheY-like chemotaxis protein
MQDSCQAVALRVLVVDDYRDAADSLAQLCGLWGHAVRVAYSGEQALEIAPSFRPQAMLLDLAMPGMDGVRLAQRLRRAESGNESVLICITGYRGLDIDRRVADAGYNHFFTKPVDPGELRRLLAAIHAELAAGHCDAPHRGADAKA